MGVEQRPIKQQGAAFAGIWEAEQFEYQTALAHYAVPSQQRH